MKQTTRKVMHMTRRRMSGMGAPAVVAICRSIPDCWRAPIAPGHDSASQASIAPPKLCRWQLDGFLHIQHIISFSVQ